MLQRNNFFCALIPITYGAIVGYVWKKNLVRKKFFINYGCGFLKLA